MQKNGRLMKKITSILMSILLVFNLVIPQAVSAEAYDPNEDYKNLDVRFWEDEKPEIGFYINAGNRYILETVPEPIFGVTSGEWSVMDLLRGMYTGYDYLNYIPEDYFQGYISRVEKHVVEKKGNLDRNKVTEWARSILTLSSLGYDISDVAGYDYIEKLSKSHKFSHRQGLNGPIWTLIALNTGNYDLYEDSTNPDANTEGKMLDYILDKEIVSSDGTKGGWALWGKTPDTDMTGMALQGLAPYYLNADLYNAAGASKSYEEFQEAVERGVYILSEIQLDNGGYFAWGSVNAESTVQVIVALTALELDPLAENIYLPKIDKTVSFWTEGGVEDGVETNNLMDALITFWASGSGTSDEVGGFKHVTAGYDGGGGSGTTVNAMATDQSIYGLISYHRFNNGQTALYDMSDMKNGEYANMVPTTVEARFIADKELTETLSPYKTITIPETDEVEGKEFNHWNSQADGKGTAYYIDDVLVMPEHNITLYGQYDNIEYNIAYVLNGGEFISDEVPTSYNVDSGDIALPTGDDLTYEGFDLAGWYDNSEFNGEPITTLPAGSIGDKVFYAHWIKEEDQQVNTVISLIDSLPNVEELKLDDKTAVENARHHFDALESTQQEQITNIDKLEILEVKISELEELADVQEAKYVAEMIEELPKLEELTLEDADEVEAARLAFYGLTIKQQDLVSNQQKLIDLINKVQELQEFEADKKAADNVETLITALPVEDELTLSDKELVKKARVAFDELTDSQKELVTNKDKLETAETKIAVLEQQAADQEVANEVNQRILGLPNSEQLDLADRSEVESVRKAYNELTDTQKDLVDQLDRLVSLENRLIELKNEADKDAAVAKEISDLISSLPKLDDLKLADRVAVETVRSKYNSLTGNQQSLVKNIEVLFALESQLNTLKSAVDKVNTAINNLPNVEDITLSNKKQVETVRKAYEVLTEEQRKLVSNVEKLEQLEVRLAEIEKSKPGSNIKPEKPDNDKDGTNGQKPNDGKNGTNGQKPNHDQYPDNGEQKSKTDKKEQKNNLPATGIQTSDSLWIVGLALIVAGSGIYLLRRKKNA